MFIGVFVGMVCFDFNGLVWEVRFDFFLYWFVFDVFDWYEV